MSQYIALICGGKSGRMRQDKAGLIVNGEPLIHRQIHDILRLGYRPLILSAGKHYPQLQHIQPHYINDLLPGHAGPLSALAAALDHIARYKRKYLYVLSADTLLPPSLLIQLLSRSLSADILMLRSTRLHPLLARYSVSLRSQAHKLLEQGERRLMLLAQSCKKRSIYCPGIYHSLLNCNTPQEFRRGLRALNRLYLPAMQYPIRTP